MGKGKRRQYYHNHGENSRQAQGQENHGGWRTLTVIVEEGFVPLSLPFPCLRSICLSATGADEVPKSDDMKQRAERKISGGREGGSKYHRHLCGGDVFLMVCSFGEVSPCRMQ